MTYEEGIKNIVEASCTNGDCHVDPNGGWAVFPNFSTYDNLLLYLESGSFGFRINTTDTILSMPPLFREDRQISNADLALLNDWLSLGFPEN